jgi:acyl carrier protein
MIPQAFVALKSFPLTEHGKINRNALPRPEEHATRKQIIAPRNDTESRLAAIWQNVLGIQNISVNDNFFAVGGDSILATRMMAVVREAFGLNIPLRTLFENPDLQHLATAIDQLMAQRTTVNRPTMRKAERRAKRIVTDETGQVIKPDGNDENK